MATPPFLPDETKPGDSDIVSQYPAVERAFRDIMESWLLIDHDTDGEHKQITLLELAADPTNAVDTGFVYTKDDAGDTELFYEDDGGAVVQITKDGAVNVPSGALVAPVGTSMFFYQSAAPSGWTKDIAATLGNHALKLVTDVAWSTGSKGATAFGSVFGAGKVTDSHALSTAELAIHSHAGGSLTAASDGLHTHGVEGFAGDGSLNRIVRSVTTQSGQGAVIAGAAQSDGAHTHSISGSTANAGSGSGHTHTLSLDLNHIQVIRATKD